MSFVLSIVADILLVIACAWVLPRRVWRFLGLDHLPAAIAATLACAGFLYILGAPFFTVRTAEAAGTYAYKVMWPAQSEECAATLIARYDLRPRSFIERAVATNPARNPTPTEIEMIYGIAFTSIARHQVKAGFGFERRLMNQALHEFCQRAGHSRS